MNTTINISLPGQMYKDARRALKEERFTSISELIRDALRQRLYQNITENGFIKSFEDEVIGASSGKDRGDVWANEGDVKKYFDSLRKRSRRGQ